MIETNFFISLIGFFIVLTPLIFIHELGHYLAAIKSGVKVESFSIGFGPELFGYTDKRNTRWKFSLLPLGGYVKMKGELITNELSKNKYSYKIDTKNDEYTSSGSHNEPNRKFQLRYLGHSTQKISKFWIRKKIQQR